MHNTLKLLLFFVLFLGCVESANAAIIYIRKDGGTGGNCNGTTDTQPIGPAPQNCALNHPAWVFPPTGAGTGRAAQSGDTVVIESGSYRIGCQNSTNCNDASVNVTSSACGPGNPFSCVMGAIPSGVTVIGCTTSGCSSQSQFPELWGAGRIFKVLDANGKSNVTIQDVEITDHAQCASGFPSGFDCPSSSTTTLTAITGIDATASSGLTLIDVNIHGLASNGISAGYISNMTIKGDAAGASKIDFNGGAGINFDACNNDGTCGMANGNFVKLLGNNPTQMMDISWNGCVESVASPGTPIGCSSFPYGDGVGATTTSGNWTINYLRMVHNTSDGLDLLYCTLSGCTIDVRNSFFGGNAGNQLKWAGNSVVYNTIVDGGCDFFSGKSYTLQVDQCRALGHAISLTYQSATHAKFYGDTIVNVKGDGAFNTGARGNISVCTSSNTLDIQNSIIQTPGGVSSSGDGQNIYFSYKSQPGDPVGGDCRNSVITQINSNINGFTGGQAGSNPAGSGNLFTNPNLTSFTVGPSPTQSVTAALTSSSPAKDTANETASGQPTTDFNVFSRGPSYDMGALEFGSSYGGTPPSCPNGTIDPGETCDSNSVTCASLGFTSGTAPCNGTCSGYVTTSCVTNLCGNGSINGNEQCDGSNINGATCGGLGYSGCAGTPGCSASCTLTQGSCAAYACGNGCVDPSEECDDGNTANGSACSISGCSARCEPETCPYELFLNYTKSDASGFQDVHTEYVNVAGLNRVATSYLRKDFGAGYFTGNFTHRFKVTINSCTESSGGAGGQIGVWALMATARTSLSAMESAGDGLSLRLSCHSNSSSYQWVLGSNNAGTFDTWQDAIPVITRYVEISRVSGTLTANFFSDPNFSVPLHAITISGGTTAYGIYASMMGYGDGTAGTQASGSVESVNLSAATTTPPTPTTYGTKISGCTCYGAGIR